MVFNSLHFVWFFVLVYAVYRVLPHRAQNWLLLVASYYFYASWDWRFLGLLIASTVVDFSCGLAIERSQSPRARRALLVASLGFNLTLLGFFKYFNFFADNLHAIFSVAGLAARFRHGSRPAPHRHLVLYVRDDELRHRRLSPGNARNAQPAGFCRVRRVFSAPRRGTDPARLAFVAADCDAADGDSRPDARRPVAHRLGVLPENLRRRQPGRRRRTSCSIRRRTRPA